MWVQATANSGPGAHPVLGEVGVRWAEGAAAELKVYHGPQKLPGWAISFLI